MTIHSNKLFPSVNKELKQLNQNLHKMIIAEHPILYAAAEKLLNTGGKRIRPALVLLVGNITTKKQKISAEQKRLAEITEVIHNASLVHDDVIDDCETRRGVETVHSIFNNKVAILTGDFLFAQSSWYLANLNNLDVVKTISKVIIDFAEGEIQQGTKTFDNKISIENYIEKSFYKTASLIACSCKATTILSHCNEKVQEDFYLFGKHLGLAFQIIDDILDITSSTESLGKPAGSDLKNGNLTAPLMFTLEEKPELNKLIYKEFENKQDINKAIRITTNSIGIRKAKDLAEEHIQIAIHIIKSKYKHKDIKDLLLVSYYVLNRIN
uniref:Prenyl transferase n=1 Tax=Ophidocladus simpliciusculus TaxID=1261574 RepID=A0A1Z1MJE7_9FLOR|nr:prenyl transferase [Ophidocladus simpliciusculus]ARW66009.1 prenyl transferase [Ophidocladus simpliciusculus]